MKKWKVLKEENVLDSKWVKVNKEKVEISNGIIIDDFYKVKIADASAIVALTKDNKIILKKEYRHCYEKELLEVPAGMINEGEIDPLVTAKRELLEETGYISNDWTFLGKTIESSSKLTNYMYLYLAKDCIKISEQKLDETEVVDIIEMDFKEALEKVENNEIEANSSISAILLTDRKINK